MVLTIVSTSRDLWTRLGGSSVSVDVPGQQFFDAVNGMLRDAGEHLAQIEFWIHSVQLGAAHERVDGGCAMSSGIGSGEEVVAATEGNRTQCALGTGVVCLDQSVIDVAGKRPPSRERIADRCGGVGLGGECGELLLKPSMEVLEQRPGWCLPYFSALFNSLATDLSFDSIQGVDTIERFGGNGRWLHLVDVVELASGVAMHAASWMLPTPYK